MHEGAPLWGPKGFQPRATSEPLGVMRGRHRPLAGIAVVRAPRLRACAPARPVPRRPWDKQQRGCGPLHGASPHAASGAITVPRFAGDGLSTGDPAQAPGWTSAAKNPRQFFVIATETIQATVVSAAAQAAARTAGGRPGRSAATPRRYTRPARRSWQAARAHPRDPGAASRRAARRTGAAPSRRRAGSSAPAAKSPSAHRPARPHRGRRSPRGTARRRSDGPA